MMNQLMQARINLANVYNEVKAGLAWYKQLMDEMKSMLDKKDLEIAELKKQLDEIRNSSSQL